MDFRNILLTVMKLDLWLLINVGKSAKTISQIFRILLETLLILGFAVGLLTMCILPYFKLQQISFNGDGGKRSPTTELIGITDRSNVHYSPEIEKTINHLKSKALNLEMAYRKMNLQLRTMYSRDLTKGIELPDFASEAAGGIVLETPNTKPYHKPKSGLTLFGFDICKPNHFTPRQVIQPWSEAGECWAFRGERGNIKIQLAYPAFVEQVSLEHVSIAASLSGKIDSAPKEFKVTAETSQKIVETEIFVYNKDGPSSQLFHITNPDFKKTPIKVLTLEILSNWGNPNYTCVYRFKVHGKISS